MSFLLQNEHWEYKRISPHEVSIAKSVRLKRMRLWGAVSGCASLPVSCSTTFLTGEAGFTGQQTAALVRQSTRCSLEKLPVLLWSTLIPVPVCLADRKPQEPTHPCAHPVSLQMQSTAPEHPGGSGWRQIDVTMCRNSGRDVRVPWVKTLAPDTVKQKLPWCGGSQAKVSW